jgi:threonine dehydratase
MYPHIILALMNPSAEDILNAHERIKPYIHETPVMASSAINDMAGCELFFKCENFQKIGAFKMRGAANAVFSTPEFDRKNGFVTHSSGNHGQAVAKAAQLAGVPAYIVMPKNSSRVKLEAVRGYGAEVILCEPNDVDRQGNADRIQAEKGASFIHPFDNLHVIAGQATAAKELLDDFPDLDIVTCPIGGGGLCAGTALSAHYFGNGVKVVGSEPENVNDAYLSFKSGERQKGNPQPTLADGLRTQVGEITFPIIKEHVSEVLTVTEEQMIAAMKIIWERMKIIIEPSCAVPLAAVLAHPHSFRGKKVGVILTGGNVDLLNLPF